MFKPAYPGNITNEIKAAMPNWMTSTKPIDRVVRNASLRVYNYAIKLIKNAKTPERRAYLFEKAEEYKKTDSHTQEISESLVPNETFPILFNHEYNEVDKNWQATYRDILNAGLIIACHVFEEYHH